jgi:hypothetical protein
MSSSGTAVSGRALRGRGKRTKAIHTGFVDITAVQLDSSDDDDDLTSISRKHRQRRLRALTKPKANNSRSGTRSRRSDPIDITSSEDTDHSSKKRRRKRNAPVEPTRRSSRSRMVTHTYDDEEDDEDEDEDSESSLDILRSDILQSRRKRKRGPERKAEKWETMRSGVRQSDRSTRAQGNMQEADEQDIYRSGESKSQPPQPKIVSVREVFATLPRSNLFRSRHV